MNIRTVFTSNFLWHPCNSEGFSKENSQRHWQTAPEMMIICKHGYINTSALSVSDELKEKGLYSIKYGDKSLYCLSLNFSSVIHRHLSRHFIKYGVRGVWPQPTYCRSLFKATLRLENKTDNSHISSICPRVSFLILSLFMKWTHWILCVQTIVHLAQHVDDVTSSGPLETVAPNPARPKLPLLLSANIEPWFYSPTNYAVAGFRFRTKECRSVP